MKISLNWLGDYIKHSLTNEEIDQLLTNCGLEVEGMEQYSNLPGSFEHVVTGHVLEVWQHPNADKLKVTRVDVGEGEPKQIVCGAPNVAAGQKVIVAKVGATLHPKNSEPLKIKKAKIRGEVSEGMICAEDELGIGISHDGIMVLKDDVQPGQPLTSVFNIYKDTVVEIGLTPNRGDAASHIGVARDLSALLRQPLKLPEVDDFKVQDEEHKLTIEVKDHQACPRYMGVVVSGLKVAESPEWLKNKLRAVGQKPINNVVDITNFVMLEVGQPLHAFDMRLVEGNKIIVRNSEAGKKFTTLDGKEREMQGFELMICNANEPIGIGGVMGGKGSSVNESTTAVFLESALFSATSIRKTARHHQLFSDASFRFERGVDAEKVPYALMRASLLLQEIAGGKISSPVYDEYPNPIERVQLNFQYSYINKLAGQKIPEKEVREILEFLGFEVLSADEKKFTIKVPTAKTEVTRPVDVAEEVLRIYGYNKIHFPPKLSSVLAFSPAIKKQQVQEAISGYLTGRGFNEIYGHSLVARQPEPIMQAMDRQEVKLLNPLSLEYSIMRSSLLGSGLMSLRHNINRQQENLRFFEFGKVYAQQGTEYFEEERLALWITGLEHSEGWYRKPMPSDFYQLKGIVQEVLALCHVPQPNISSNPGKNFTNGQHYHLSETELVRFGQLSPKLLEQNEIGQQVFYSEINLGPLYQFGSRKDLRYKPISKFPVIVRDLSMLLQDRLSYAEIKASIEKAAGPILKDIAVFDVYEGKNIPAGKKSYAIRLWFADEEKTLQDKQVERVMERITDQLNKQYEVEIRK